MYVCVCVCVYTHRKFSPPCVSNWQVYMCAYIHACMYTYRHDTHESMAQHVHSSVYAYMYATKRVDFFRMGKKRKNGKKTNIIEHAHRACTCTYHTCMPRYEVGQESAHSQHMWFPPLQSRINIVVPTFFFLVLFDQICRKKIMMHDACDARG